MLVSEIFPSIQGEGILIGVPMTFVRLSSCNLRCTWCDTKYAWEKELKVTEEQIVEEVNQYPNDWVCVTGGEPFLQNCDKLFDLLSASHKIAVETNGTISPTALAYTLTSLMTISPKLSNSGMKSELKPEIVAELLCHRNAQLKFVCANKSDVEEAVGFCESLTKDYSISFRTTPIVFQPQSFAFENLETYLSGVRELSIYVQSCKCSHPEWNLRVLCQLHRVLFGLKRGV